MVDRKLSTRFFLMNQLIWIELQSRNGKSYEILVYQMEYDKYNVDLMK